MESTRPIRALKRGLDALSLMNLHDGVTVSGIAKELRLPRTTVYRLLETLCRGGFIFRDSLDERYRLSPRVRGLSRGFQDEAWLARIAKPCIAELCSELVWPVSIATLAGNDMMLRETTDHATPLAIERYSAGCRLPLLSSAAGHTYLAWCPMAERDRLLTVLASGPLDALLKQLGEVRTRGYATLTRTRRLGEEVTISVPLSVPGGVLAAVAVRFISSVVPIGTALERFFPRLQHCAARIAGGLSAG